MRKVVFPKEIWEFNAACPYDNCYKRFHEDLGGGRAKYKCFTGGCRKVTSSGAPEKNPPKEGFHIKVKKENKSSLTLKF